MITYVKLLLLLVLVCSLLYGGLVLFPQKLRLLRRVGMEKTNDDLIKLAKSGDVEAAELFRKSRRFLWIALPAGVALSLLQGLTKK